MPTATAIEVSATSATGFEDAINRGLHQACAGIRNLRHLCSAQVREQQMVVQSGQAAIYRVKMQVTFTRDSENPEGAGRA
ncbi:MAG: dodecin domain-containing protein [Polaromonas sp.]|nr:dodecin domain-containing protein [Polaromonas sp.]